MCHEVDYISILPTEFEVFQPNGLAALSEESQAIVEVCHVRRLDYTSVQLERSRPISWGILRGSNPPPHHELCLLLVGVFSMNILNIS